MWKLKYFLKQFILINMDVLTYIINLTRTKFYIINNNFSNRKFKSLCFVYRMPQWIIYQLFPNSNVLKGLPGCSIMIKKSL